MTNSSSSFPDDAAHPVPLARDLRVLLQGLRAHLGRSLAAAGFADVAGAPLAVLAQPDVEGARPSVLAERSGMTKQAMHHLIDQLEREGYLERRPDPADSRARLLHLTPKGEEVSRHVRASVAELEREWAQRIGAERYATLRSALRELVQQQ